MSVYDKYEMVIWLEIHVKLNSPNKLFCQCRNEQDFEWVEPNTHICPVCSGQPGALPVMNEEPLKKAILLGLALNCEINSESRFDRKSYFYPDLPMGYQITQFEIPTNDRWRVKFWIKDYQEQKEVGIQRAHIENDAWKTIHEWWKAYLDYNRAWTPLVEIVTDPDFRSAEEVVEFLKELQRLVRYNNIWYADMEKGQLRCDVNISVRPKWSDKFGTKVEMKNLNSFGAIKRAIEHEFKRQVDLIESWWEVQQETRWWDDTKRTSYVMRSKEDAMDYRYFTEPDLPPLKVDNDFIEEIKSGIVESTYERIKRYKEKYGFSKEFINWLISNHRVNFWFEKLVEFGIDPKLAAKWINMYILRYLDDKGLKNISQIKLDRQYKDLSEDDVKMLAGKEYVEYSIWELSQLLPFDFEKFYKLLKLIQDRKIWETQAKQVIIDMFNTGKDPEQIVEEKWLWMADEGEILSIINQVLDENPQAVEDIKNWQQKAVGFLIGQVMRKSGWKADPKFVKEKILEIING